MLGLGTLRRVAGEIARDVASARERDPAAKGVGSLEILTGWAGVQALLAHRVAHALWEAEVPLAPRTIAYATRAVTGVEIHPAATIGSDFFIDHGSGVVIGETTEIGDRVTLFQGVTLGGTGFEGGKRHPTLEDGVTVGSGAKLLGPVTIGRNSKVGANTVVIEDVPASTTVVGNPGHPVRVEGKRPEGPDVDWIHLPDPIAEAIKELSGRISRLERKLAEARGEGGAAGAGGGEDGGAAGGGGAADSGAADSGAADSGAAAGADAGIGGGAGAEVTELRPRQGPSSAGG